MLMRYLSATASTRQHSKEKAPDPPQLWERECA